MEKDKKGRVVLNEKEKAAIIKQYGALPFTSDEMNQHFIPKKEEKKEGK